MDHVLDFVILAGDHVFTVAGFLLAVFLIARLLREPRPSGVAMAWLLGIMFLPYVGVPMYMIFAGRKIRRLIRSKAQLYSPELFCLPLPP